MVGTIGTLFEREPASWGLRGDPWLWRALRERFADVAVPADRGALEAVLRVRIAAELGVPLTSPHGAWVSVERFAHGGMSSGLVSLEWWREHGFPLIVRRARVPGARFSIRATTEEDWPVLRALRVQNATENPVSYGATLDTTLAMTEDDWRLRARRGTAQDAMSVVAIAPDGRWLGVMGAQDRSDDGDGGLLTGVYVLPEVRGRRHGVADALLGEVLAWASGRVDELRLWVDGEAAGEPARRFYRRHGFEDTGRRRAVGLAPGDLVEMLRAV